MKNVVIRLLRFLARRQLARFAPVVVGVTGSVGKTSTKQAIAIALAARFSVRTSEKNYNNEIGLPLAVLGERSPGKNVLGWALLFVRAWRATSMPRFLVLEYGADGPGDIRALCALALPNVAVITAVSPVHLANYPDINALIAEKATLGQAVPREGTVFLNADDGVVLDMRSLFSAHVELYGFADGAETSVRDVRFATRVAHGGGFGADETFATTTADVVHCGDSATLELSNAIGSSPLSACLAGVAVATHFGVPLRDAVLALAREFRPASGRLRPIAGIKGTIILDDTYNAAPASTMAALSALKLFAPASDTARRIAVLGRMAELGGVSEAEHRAIGHRVAGTADVFVAVGDDMRAAAEEAILEGMKAENVVTLASPEEAGRYCDALVKQGDVVLVKGSQSARMEKVVKAIMAEPNRAAELLVRQDGKWLAT